MAQPCSSTRNARQSCAWSQKQYLSYGLHNALAVAREVHGPLVEVACCQLAHTVPGGQVYRAHERFDVFCTRRLETNENDLFKYIM